MLSAHIIAIYAARASGAKRLGRRRFGVVAASPGLTGLEDGGFAAEIVGRHKLARSFEQLWPPRGPNEARCFGRR